MFLKALEYRCRKLGKIAVVGFADGDVINFYIKAGWYYIKKVGPDKRMFASVPLPVEVEAKETW